jgi:hypothetical protein
MYQWQQNAVARMHDGNCLLAAMPGSGKTITTLTLIRELTDRHAGSRVLLVAPWIILETVWQQEAVRWEHTHTLTFAMAHRLTGAYRARCWFARNTNIVTCTFDTLAKLRDEVVRTKVVPFDFIVVDESQGFKNPGSVRCGALHDLAQITKRTYLCSGTPSPNGAIDMWSPGAILSQYGRFWGENFYKWRAAYFDKQGAFGFRPKVGSTKLIQNEFAKVSIAIKLEDAVDVPAALRTTQWVDYCAQHNARINEFLKDRKVEIKGVVYEAQDDGGFLQKAHQLTQGFFYLSEDLGVEYFSDAKVVAMREILETVTGPVLVGIRFKADIAMLKAAFPQATVFAGGTNQALRAQIVADFNANKIPMLLGHPSAMGHGINLQLGAAATIVWFCQSFSWEARAQFEARLIRNGQRNKVSVITIAARAGIDGAITQVLERKQNSESALLDAININKKGQ